MHHHQTTARPCATARPAARRAGEFKQLQMVALGALTGGLLLACAILLMR